MPVNAIEQRLARVAALLDQHAARVAAALLRSLIIWIDGQHREEEIARDNVLAHIAAALAFGKKLIDAALLCAGVNRAGCSGVLGEFWDLNIAGQLLR